MSISLEQRGIDNLPGLHISDHQTRLFMSYRQVRATFHGKVRAMMKPASPRGEGGLQCRTYVRPVRRRPSKNQCPTPKSNSSGPDGYAWFLKIAACSKSVANNLLGSCWCAFVSGPRCWAIAQRTGNVSCVTERSPRWGSWTSAAIWAGSVLLIQALISTTWSQTSTDSRSSPAGIGGACRC